MENARILDFIVIGAKRQLHYSVDQYCWSFVKRRVLENSRFGAPTDISKISQNWRFYISTPIFEDFFHILYFNSNFWRFFSYTIIHLQFLEIFFIYYNLPPIFEDFFIYYVLTPIFEDFFIYYVLTPIFEDFFSYTIIYL